MGLILLAEVRPFGLLSQIVESLDALAEKFQIEVHGGPTRLDGKLAGRIYLSRKLTIKVLLAEAPPESFIRLSVQGTTAQADRLVPALRTALEAIPGIRARIMLDATQAAKAEASTPIGLGGRLAGTWVRKAPGAEQAAQFHFKLTFESGGGLKMLGRVWWVTGRGKSMKIAN